MRTVILTVILTGLFLGLAAAPGASAFPGEWNLDYPPIELSADGGDHNDPAVASGADGTTAVGWIRHEDGEYLVQARVRPPGGEFGPIEILTVADILASQIDLAVGPDGTVIAVWQEALGDDVMIRSAVLAPGGDPQPPVDISPRGGDSSEPRIVIAPDGTATVVWSRYVIAGSENHTMVQASVRAPNGVFGTAKDLSPVNGNVLRPAIAVGPGGTVGVVWSAAVWTGGQLTGIESWVTFKPHQSVFKPPVRISPDGESAVLPSIAFAAGDEATIAWINPDTPDIFADEFRIRARTVTASGQAGPLDTLSANGPARNFSGLTSGADGTTAALWGRPDGSESILEVSVRPPGGSFGVVEELGTRPAGSGLPALGVGPDGSVTAAWLASDGTVKSRTRVPGGEFAPATTLSTEGAQATDPFLSVLPDGMITGVWQEGNSGAVHARSTEPMQVRLDVSRLGVGQGTVRSSPRGINCGPVCDQRFPSFAAVTLTADPAEGSVFKGWSGDCSGRRMSCEVTMDRFHAVAAEFQPASPSRSLSVNLAGAGSGSVRSSPAGIECGSACEAEFPGVQTVTLTAEPAAGSRFDGWSEDCGGAALTCTVTVTRQSRVTASFSPVPEVVCPPSGLKSGKLTLNRRNGTAKLAVRASGSGKVTLKGSKLVRPATVKVSRNGKGKVTVRVRGRPARRLRKTGRTRVRLKLVYQPDEGCKPARTSVQVRLRRRLK